MFDPALEYRKYVQRKHTDEEKRQKLANLASKVRTTKKDTRPLTAIMAVILESYTHGDDILDPELFEREDIVSFALENGIQDDPMVVEFINRAQPRCCGLM